MKKKFPKIPPHYKIKAIWWADNQVIAVAQCKEENKTRLFRWNGIDENINEYWTYESF